MRKDSGSLRHVLWIGGATDSGKTSVADALGERHGLQVYHYDLYDRESFPGHWARATSEDQPAMTATRVGDWNWMWVDTTPDELVQRWRETTPERFALTLEDLRALPAHPPILTEGYGFTPELVAPLLASPHQAIWLVSTEEFKRATYERRGKGAFAGTRDPTRARRNHIERDLLLAELIRQEAQQRKLTILQIDGGRPLVEIANLVDAHFEPYLRSL